MCEFWQIISRFFRWCWRSLNFIKNFILNVLIIIFVITLTWSYLQIRHTPTFPKKGALIVDLTGTVVDKLTMNNKFRQLGRELLGISSNQLHENSLFSIVDKLRQAKNDTNITGIVLSLMNFTGTDQASLQYIGKALREFRDSGKPIYAIGENYSQAQYFLASYANKIYLTPQGEVDLHGIASNNFYYKSFLDKLKIHSHVFRVGTYKSAVEPFLRDDMSDNARQANSRWIEQLWQHYLNEVATNRKITPYQLFPGAQVILDSLRAVKGNAAQLALNQKWVDEIAPRVKIDDELIKIFGFNKYKNTFNGISIYDYRPMHQISKDNKIAVIFASGMIVDGPEIKGYVGSETIARQIRNARLDQTTKAIVFRVNSPGGSVTASEIIRSELAAVRTSGKPVIVSMGGTAASGGYWISTPADYIIASASTLTGSIGIFGVIHTLESLLDSIGIHTDGIATSPLADVSVTKTLPSEFSQKMQLNVENGYENFINLVAQSRHKKPEEVDNIGQGYVWIGNDAVKNGLVDQVGDFDDAVNKAAELAKLQHFNLYWYLDEPSLLDLFFTQTNTYVHSIISSLIKIFLPPIPLRVLDEIDMHTDSGFYWNDPQNRYALCLSCQEALVS